MGAFAGLLAALTSPPAYRPPPLHQWRGGLLGWLGRPGSPGDGAGLLAETPNGVYYSPRYDVSTEKGNAVALSPTRAISFDRPKIARRMRGVKRAHSRARARIEPRRAK